jgi:surfactin synthase thioesterase subunit
MTHRDVEGEVICIPTAIIYGRNDTTINGEIVSSLCASNKKEIYVHDGGHEILGARMNSAVKACVQIIRRVISMATIYEH